MEYNAQIKWRKGKNVYMLKNRKIYPDVMLEYIAVAWIIISSGFFVLNYVYNMQCMLILFCIALYYLIRKKSINKKNAIRFMGILIFIVIDESITLLIYNYPLSVTSLIILIIRLFSLAVIMGNISAKNFIKKYIDIFTVISVISLVCFFIISFTSIGIPFAKNYKDGFYGSFYFRVNEYTRSIATRNSGPYGEPGIFAVYIVIALVFQLFSTSANEVTKGVNGIKTVVLALALLTTLSGTGLLCFLIIVIAYVIINFKEVNILKNPIMFFIVIVMVIGFYYAETTYGILGEKIINKGGSYGVRLNDTLVGYQIAIKYFWTGTGIANDYTSAWKHVLLANSRSNGLANFSASVGIPFLFLYLIVTFKQLKIYMNQRVIPAIVFFAVIIIIFNTQPIVFQTIGLSFLFRWKNKNDRSKTMLNIGS